MDEPIGIVGGLLDTPDDQVIARLAAELNRTIHSTSRELVRKELRRSESVTRESAADHPYFADAADKRNAMRHEHLTRLRVLRAARANLDRAVLEARMDGLTWKEIGDGCGMSRQAAYDRWGKLAKQLEEARLEARKPANREDLDPIEWVINWATSNRGNS